MTQETPDGSGAKDRAGCIAAVAIAAVLVGLLVAENYFGVLSGCDRSCQDRKIAKSVEEFNQLPASEQAKIIEEQRREDLDETYRGM